MQDTIEINLRALDDKTRNSIKELLEQQLEIVDDEVNERALQDISMFDESDDFDDYTS